MQTTSFYSSYMERVHDFYQWRTRSGVVTKMALSFGFALAIALSAQVRMPLPWTPVPVTGQTMAIFLAAIVMGRRWSGVPMLFYVALGILGLPVFTGLKGGAVVLLGPTGGYLLGYTVAAFIIGAVTDASVASRRPGMLLALMLGLNFLLVHPFGLVHLGLWMEMVQGSFPGLGQLAVMGSIPFIAGDIVKIIITVLAAQAIVSRRSFK